MSIPVSPDIGADADRAAARWPTSPTSTSPAIVVMGVSGSGKSTLAPCLAAALGGAFLEGDLFHDAASIAAMRDGRALTDEDRWPWLDRIGAAMRAAIDERGVVVATCSALKRAYRERLAKAIGLPPRYVLLLGKEEDLVRRLAARQGHYMPASLLASQLATLEMPDDGEDAVMLDAALPPDQLCREAVGRLRHRA